MSRSTQLLREIKTGVHLLVITDAKAIDNGVQIRFSDGNNNLYDKQYYFDENSLSDFLKLCSVVKVNPNKPKFKSNIIGTRLWGCFNEVYDINLDQIIYSKGKPVVNHYLFDILRLDNVEKKPIVPGCPDEKTPAGGLFLSYRQVDVEKELSKEERLEIGKKIISEWDAF